MSTLSSLDLILALSRVSTGWKFRRKSPSCKTIQYWVPWHRYFSQLWCSNYMDCKGESSSSFWPTGRSSIWKQLTTSSTTESSGKNYKMDNTSQLQSNTAGMPPIGFPIIYYSSSKGIQITMRTVISLTKFCYRLRNLRNSLMATLWWL